MADLITIPSGTAANREAQHPTLCGEQAGYGTCGPKNLHTACPCLSAFGLQGEKAWLHVWQHSLPHARPLMPRLTGVANHCATEKDTVLKLVNVFWFVSIFITRWEEDGDVLYVILGHILDQSFGQKQERRKYLHYANKTTENMTTTQVLPLNTSLLKGGSWVITSLVTDGVLKV